MTRIPTTATPADEPEGPDPEGQDGISITGAVDEVLPDGSLRDVGTGATIPAGTAPSPRMAPPSGAPPHVAAGPVAGQSTLSPREPEGPPPDLDLFGHAPRGRRDWSHRRGEPRVFALLWTVFLTVLATTTLMRAAVGGRLDLWVYRDALRSMLMVVVTAIVVAWPLLRLSQARPRGSGCAATVKDVLIVLVPLQAVIWPQAILARWPIGVIGAVAALLGVWTLTCGGVIALALGPGTQDPEGLPDAEITRPDPARGRVAAMAVVVGLGAVGGALAFVLDTAMRPGPAIRDPGAWWAMLSPHTGIAELTRDRSGFGEAARAEPALLWTLAAQAGLGATIWIAALVREVASGRGDQRPDGTGRVADPALAPDGLAR